MTNAKTHGDSEFKKHYNRLNPEQLQAVNTIDGPVLVVAGPGTGKTEILTVRIAHILKKGVSPASGILALTFTNSGVRAMRERLTKIIGGEASHVTITTFHAFGISLISEFYEELSLERPPKLITEIDQVILFDELLEHTEWHYLRPRSGGEHNFGDLKSLISLLRQERMSPSDFLYEIKTEIDRILHDPESISSRGPTKGKMKTAQKEKIERFERTKEASAFYELYEKTKKERGLMDYDDVLEYIVELVTRSEDVRATIRERYLYVLIDEHQDSSGVQNKFIETVWSDVEQPNIFVVGDDRQLIYAFGGASLSHFERFPNVFSGTKVITLKVNRRSTQRILDVAHALLTSSLVTDMLVSVSTESYPVTLVEAAYPRDEILKAGLEIKKNIEAGVPPHECVILVPKKAQVVSASAVLHDLGLPVASLGKSQFLSMPETQTLVMLLRALAQPYDGSRIAALLLDSTFGVSFLSAQKFLREHGHRLSFESLEKGDETILALKEMFASFLEYVGNMDVYRLIQHISDDVFFKKTTSHAQLLVQIEVVRTMLHLALELMEKTPRLTLAEFVTFLDRLESYGQDIPLAVFSGQEGVKVMTLHASKGLEFDVVWIAHLDEGSLMRGKKLAITLPESVKEKITKKDELTAKRELYVGITRARRFCTLSYARSGYNGTDQQLAKILQELPDGIFEKKSAHETEQEILKENKIVYVASKPISVVSHVKKEITDLVSEHYADKPTSVTHLNNFFSCPWKWYFRNFLELPEPESETLQFGTLVHTVIEHIIKHGSGSPEKISELLDTLLDDMHIFEAHTRTRFSTDAHVVLDNFVKKHAADFASAYSEKKASAYRDPAIPRIEMSGKIDVVQTMPDGTLTVTDFKTGRVKTAQEIEKINDDGRMSDMLRQLAMYSYLLEHEKGNPKVSCSQLLFLEVTEHDANELYKTTIGIEEIERLRKDILEYDNLLFSGEWVNLPCTFKPFGQQKECYYCALARRLR